MKKGWQRLNFHLSPLLFVSSKYISWEISNKIKFWFNSVVTQLVPQLQWSSEVFFFSGKLYWNSRHPSFGNRDISLSVYLSLSLSLSYSLEKKSAVDKSFPQHLHSVTWWVPRNVKYNEVGRFSEIKFNAISVSLFLCLHVW